MLVKVASAEQVLVLGQPDLAFKAVRDAMATCFGVSAPQFAKLLGGP